MELLILESGSIGTRQLAEHFGISLNTLRHDIAELSTRGKIVKVYGGVAAVKNTVTSVSERRYQNYGIKMRIGEFASSLVEDGKSIFIDGGTTAVCMIPFLSKVKNVNLTTHSLGVLENVSGLTNLSIVSLGGKYDFLTRSFLDYEAMEMLRDVRFDYVFVGASSIKPDGIYAELYLPSIMKTAIIESGDNVVILSDYSKFNKPAPHKSCDFTKVDYLVTDKTPPLKIMDAIEENNIKLFLV